jgi:hypothetical protein
MKRRSIAALVTLAVVLGVAGCVEPVRSTQKEPQGAVATRSSAPTTERGTFTGQPGGIAWHASPPGRYGSRARLKLANGSVIMVPRGYSGSLTTTGAALIGYQPLRGSFGGPRFGGLFVGDSDDDSIGLSVYGYRAGFENVLGEFEAGYGNSQGNRLRGWALTRESMVLDSGTRALVFVRTPRGRSWRHFNLFLWRRGKYPLWVEARFTRLPSELSGVPPEDLPREFLSYLGLDAR